MKKPVKRGSIIVVDKSSNSPLEYPVVNIMSVMASGGAGGTRTKNQNKNAVA